MKDKSVYWMKVEESKRLSSWILNDNEQKFRAFMWSKTLYTHSDQTILYISTRKYTEQWIFHVMANDVSFSRMGSSCICVGGYGFLNLYECHFNWSRLEFWCIGTWRWDWALWQATFLGELLARSLSNV